MGDAMMNVKWSREMACYTWTCLYGCAPGWDFESAQEAADDFARHACAMSC